MSARETGDLPSCVLCGSLNGIIDRQVMPLSITRGPGHRELWSVMACERCAVAIVENNSKGTGASTSPGFDSPSAHPVSTSDAPVPAPPPPAPAQAGWTEGDTVRALTAAMREADEAFDRVGGSTRHHVRDCLLPVLEKHGIAVVPVTAPHFHKVRVKLPEKDGASHTTQDVRMYAEGWNTALARCAAALRSAGVEIEGEQ